MVCHWVLTNRISSRIDFFTLIKSITHASNEGLEDSNKKGSMKFLSICAIGALSLLVIGCGPSVPKPTATLSGKVTLSGSPAPAGTTIQFIDNATGNVAVGLVGQGGAYTATTNGEPRIFAGNYVVSAKGPEIVVDADAAMEPGFKPPTDPVPAKYQSAEASGEKVTVVDGENTYDLDMTP